MARRQAALTQRFAQGGPPSRLVVIAEEGGFETIEMSELFLRPQGRVIGDVVGGAHEIIERQDDGAMARVDQPRRDRKVFIAVALAGPQV